MLEEKLDLLIVATVLHWGRCGRKDARAEGRRYSDGGLDFPIAESFLGDPLSQRGGVRKGGVDSSLGVSEVANLLNCSDLITESPYESPL